MDTSEERSAVLAQASASAAPIIPECVIADGRIITTPERAGAEHGGERRSSTSNRTTDPITIITDLANEYPIIYITDVNGLERNKPQLPVLQRLAKSAEAHLWIEPGIRYSDTIIDIIVSGAAEVVLSTSTLIGFHELIDALELTPNIIFNIDYDLEQRRILSADSYTQGYSIEELFQQLLTVGIHRIIFSLHPTIVDLTAGEPGARELSRCPSVFEQITSFVLSPPRYRSSRSYRRGSLEHSRPEGSTGAVQLFARGSHVWEHREWLLDHGWTGVITDMVHPPRPEVRRTGYEDG